MSPFVIGRILENSVKYDVIVIEILFVLIPSYNRLFPVCPEWNFGKAIVPSFVNGGNKKMVKLLPIT